MHISAFFNIEYNVPCSQHMEIKTKNKNYCKDFELYSPFFKHTAFIQNCMCCFQQTKQLNLWLVEEQTNL